jgi:heme-degrading monooxygenase HmoA
MYMQLTWAKLAKADNWALIEEIYRQRGHVDTPGLLARWVARDGTDPESFFGLTLWQDLASTQAWDLSPERAKLVDQLRPFLVGSFSASVCEVMIEDLSGYVRKLTGEARSAR